MSGPNTSIAVDDFSQKTDGPGANVKINVIGMDKPFFVALALAVSMLSAFYSFETGRQVAQKVYWDQRQEAFLEQLAAQGVLVPKDILDHIKKEHSK